MNTPAADVDVTVPLVERLLRQQHPDLARLPLVPLASGWDNTIMRLGGHLTVRLPRRESAAALVLNEQRWPGRIAARVGVALPVPVRTGVPGCGYPWHWSVNRWFEGRTAAALPVPERRRLARPLAGFAARMHVPAPGDAPANPFRGVPLAARYTLVRARLAAGPFPRAGELLSLWERLAAAPAWPGPPLWLHGDLHPANILVTSGGAPEPAAVLDFGDLTPGDPATDLAVAWLLFDAPGRAAFRARLEEFSPVDPHTWDRARAWALLFGSLLYASDDASSASAGAHALEQVLS
ncbi:MULTISPECIES: aminoglycoside phosphotransferase family protein [Nocardiopsis]|uniref:Phosphotransferase n=1 Tax=Nocardiopsis sinuspersici TaxID=501010 RepID=A0A1V3C730_9ACTN|nr:MULTISPECIES: aminoglycoside phosphotransferase family protein [Nocardiopsis]OOC56442.1 phosphotransferase [Nocardiopsis sinuspersici]